MQFIGEELVNGSYLKAAYINFDNSGITPYLRIYEDRVFRSLSGDVSMRENEYLIPYDEDIVIPHGDENITVAELFGLLKSVYIFVRSYKKEMADDRIA